MRISYRVVSSIVAVTFVVVAVIGLLFDSSRARKFTSVAVDGAIQIDPCTMWEQIPTAVRLSTTLSSVTTLILLVQGFRNRSVPRWAAILCLVAPIPTIHHEYWQRHECYTKLSATLLWICIFAVGLMCVRQILHRRPHEKGGSSEPPQGQGGMTP